MWIQFWPISDSIFHFKVATRTKEKAIDLTASKPVIYSVFRSRNPQPSSSMIWVWVKSWTNSSLVISSLIIDGNSIYGERFHVPNQWKGGPITKRLLFDLYWWIELHHSTTSDYLMFLPLYTCACIPSCLLAYLKAITLPRIPPTRNTKLAGS